MANTKSAKKALRQSLKKRRANLVRRASTKSVIKDFQKLLALDKKEEARTLLKKVYSKIDKLSKTHVVHKNKARRLKSKHAKMIAQSQKKGLR